MRPVLLEIDGFTSYREKTVIDFRDVEFFALVGATGSGKSTVLDAMTFALYGSAPRWGRENAVREALSPTATRAVVRLVFDSAGRRYSVVRDVRRAGGKAQTISVREQRLERFHDADDDGTGETEVLESGDAVKTRVAELLGLTFTEFCTCVVLPQGEFSTFLNATTGERQTILSKLLGHGIYERIRITANTQAASEQSRCETLEHRLGQFPPVDLSAIAVLEDRVRAMAALEISMAEDLLPALDAARTTAAALELRISTLDAERDALAAVEIPANVDTFNAAYEEASRAFATARATEEQADSTEAQVRTALDEATPRHRLEQRLSDWDELRALTDTLPGLQADNAESEQTATAADIAARRAEKAIESARELEAVAKSAADAGAKATTTAEQALDLLLEIQVPAEVRELAVRRRETDERLRAAKSEQSAAESAEEAAQRGLDASPDAALIAAARAAAERIARAEPARAALTTAVLTRESNVSAAKKSLESRERASAAAQQALHEATLGDHVTAVRETLRPGAPCPVCEQAVASIPPARRSPQADSARVAASEADGELTVAQRHLAETERNLAAKTAELRSLQSGIDADSSDLATRLSSLLIATTAEIDVLANARTTLVSSVESARQRLATARAAIRAVEFASTELASMTQRASAQLRAARDRVLHLGAPELDEHPDLGWDCLATWAQQRASALNADLPQLEEAAAGANAEYARKVSARQVAEAAAKSARQATTAAALAKQQAAQALLNAQQRHAELTTALVSTPDAAATSAELSAVTDLEATYNSARVALTTARARLRSARTVLEAAAARNADAWVAMRRTRDPLTALGAPDLGPDTGDLAAAWRRFSSWAVDTAAGKSHDVDRLRSELAISQETVEQAENAVMKALSAAGIAPGTAGPAAAVAKSAANAENDLDRAKADFAQTESLRADIAAAREKSQVARELGQLMRSDKFPRWLVDSALHGLVTDASSVLFELSGGQFDLTTADSKILVIDHNNADLTRPVNTLSGGETFQASLALALALSRQISALSAAGGAKLEAIFLDEGFGTLDADTLDEVAATLENLAASGSRMVGVVTHVAALADRIPVRYRVTRDNTGSRVTVERS